MPNYSQSCILLAIASNESNPPDIVTAKRYEKLMLASLKSYFSLVKDNISNQNELLSSQIYNAAFDEEEYSNYLDTVTKKIRESNNADACLIYITRIYYEENQEKEREYKLDQIVSSSNSIDDTLELNKLWEQIVSKHIDKDYYTEEISDLSTIEYSNTKLIHMLTRDYESEATHDYIKFVLCIINNKQIIDKTMDQLLNINREKLLENTFYRIKDAISLINIINRNIDIKAGFNIIKESSSKILNSRGFTELSEVLHKMYGKTYEEKDEETLSGTVNVLKESYFAIFTLVENDSIEMAEVSKKHLPPNPPSFQRGKGLTGSVLDSTTGESFFPRVEAATTADMNCKIYWNNLLRTHSRYFYGKQFEYGNVKGVFTVIGKRTNYFQEKFFYNTVSELFEILTSIVKASGMKIIETCKRSKYPAVVNSIIKEKGVPDKNVFLMVRFNDDDKYNRIRKIIKGILTEYDLKLLVADDKKFDQILNVNLEAYMDSCKYGIVIFDEHIINPNIAFEFGYMYRSGASCLILKDEKVTDLKANFTQQIYNKVNLNQIETLEKPLRKWIEELGFAKK